MKIKGIDGMSGRDLARELENGGKFVMYSYTISVILMTFRTPTSIYFVPAGESRVAKGLGFTMISFFLGWWGIPWGPIYTIGDIGRNFSGGKDLTEEVVASINAHIATPEQFSDNIEEVADRPHPME